MSAIAAFLQRDAAHMMTDGLAYIDGVPVKVDCHKTYEIAGMKAALCCTGPEALGPILACLLAHRFTSFDDVVADGADVIKGIFLRYVARERGGDAIANLALIGWHEATQKPGLYSMIMAAGGKTAAHMKQFDAHVGMAEISDFVLLSLEVMSTPCPTIDQFTNAGYDFLAPLDEMIPEIDLLHELEIQRRMVFDGRCIVGGHAHLTTVDASGVHQRIVHRWHEDEVGKAIEPEPINWKAWRARAVIWFSPLARSRQAAGWLPIAKDHLHPPSAAPGR